MARKSCDIEGRFYEYTIPVESAIQTASTGIAKDVHREHGVEGKHSELAEKRIAPSRGARDFLISAQLRYISSAESHYRESLHTAHRPMSTAVKHTYPEVSKLARSWAPLKSRKELEGRLVMSKPMLYHQLMSTPRKRHLFP